MTEKKLADYLLHTSMMFNVNELKEVPVGYMDSELREKCAQAIVGRFSTNFHKSFAGETYGVRAIDVYVVPRDVMQAIIEREALAMIKTLAHVNGIRNPYE
jgi:hypothetical protein